jgi:hypothetical protein
MNLISAAKSVSGAVGKIFGLVDDLQLSGEEKQQFKLQMETLLQQRDSEIEQTYRAEMDAHKTIALAEIQSGDRYVKYARPSVIYGGIFVIFANYILMPIIALIWNLKIPEFQLPAEWWYAWTGIVSVYSIGRSAERRGVSNIHAKRLISQVTGNPQN